MPWICIRELTKQSQPSQDPMLREKCKPNTSRIQVHSFIATITCCFTVTAACASSHINYLNDEIGMYIWQTIIHALIWGGEFGGGGCWNLECSHWRDFKTDSLLILRLLHTYGVKVGRQLKRLQIALSCNSWFRTFAIYLEENRQRLMLNSLYHYWVNNEYNKHFNLK
jgi:hypothetical protein